MDNVKIIGTGHLSKTKVLEKIKKANEEKIAIFRQWRLGDVIMCEPVANYFSKNGMDVIFCTRNQYHPIIKSFRSPIKTMTYLTLKQRENIRPIASREIDLDAVGLVHGGHVSKVDAFLAAAGIRDEISGDEKIPTIQIQNQHLSRGKMLLIEKGVSDEAPIIAIIRHSFSEQSPRSVSLNILNEAMIKLSRDYQVIILGEKPSEIPINKNIYNFTGCTPDLMSVAGILAKCKILITIDTGLMHLAGAICLPMVSILGPTRPDDISSFYKYNTILDYGKDCSPCFDRGCDDNCLKKVSSEQIVKYTIERINELFAPTEIIKLS